MTGDERAGGTTDRGWADWTVWTALLSVFLPLVAAYASGVVDIQRWKACADPLAPYDDLDAGGRFAVTGAMVLTAMAAYVLVPLVVVVVRRLAPARSPGWGIVAACVLAFALSVLWWGTARGCADIYAIGAAAPAIGNQLQTSSPRSTSWVEVGSNVFT